MRTWLLILSKSSLPNFPLKVVLIHPPASFPRLAVFRALSRCDLDLEVWITNAKDNKTNIEENLPFRVKQISGPALWLNSDKYYSFNWKILPMLFRCKPDVVISLGMSFNALFALCYTKLMRKGLVIWSGGTSLSESRISKAKGLWRKTLVQLSDCFLAYGSPSSNYLETLGAKNECIFKSYNVVDNAWWTEHAEQITSEVQEKFNCIFVGQLIKRKRVDFILNLARLCLDKQLQVHFSIVGSGAEKDKIVCTANELGLTNVVFYDYQPPGELVKLYCSADVLLLPSQDIWGLVVNETMCCGVIPIVSPSAECSVDLIDHDRNGFVVDFSKPEEVLKILTDLLHYDTMRSDISKDAKSTIMKYSPDYWASQAEKAIQFASLNQTRHDICSKPETPLMRVSLVSHVYLEEFKRDKLKYLADIIDLRLISPDRIPNAFGARATKPSSKSGYQLEFYKSFFPTGIRTSTRWVLASIDLGLRKFQPDIIHVENEIHSFSVLQALAYRRLYAPGAKVVVFVWANQPLSRFKSLLLHPLAKIAQKGIDYYIAGSIDSKNLLIKNGVPPHLISVFPHSGVNDNVYTPVSLEEHIRMKGKVGFAENEFLIGYAGRFVLEKGIHDLIEAFNLLKKQMPNNKVRLLFIGDGPLKRDLCGISNDVKVFSPGGRKEVLPYYHIMDILVLPSRTTSFWTEQFGLVLVEAMACGVPVIGSDSGAIPEVIGNAGLIFPEGDVHKLAEHIKVIYLNPDLASKYGHMGRVRVIEHYTDKKIADQTIEVYKKML